MTFELTAQGIACDFDAGGTRFERARPWAAAQLIVKPPKRLAITCAHVGLVENLAHRHCVS